MAPTRCFVSCWQKAGQSASLISRVMGLVELKYLDFRCDGRAAGL
jgi:hypothetical protein